MNTDIEEKRPLFSREYRSAFILDRAKLIKILNIVEEGFQRLGCQPTYRYAVKLSNGSKRNVSSLYDLFKLDNTVRNPINLLKIKAIDIDGAASKIECDIWFTPLDFFQFFRDSFQKENSTKDQKENSTKDQKENSTKDQKENSTNIFLKVAASDTKLASQIFDELEEQIERTLFTSWAQAFGLLGLIAVSLLLIIIVIFVILLLLSGLKQYQDFISSTVPISEVRLNYENMKQLAEQAKTASSIDEKINFLFNLQRQQVENAIASANPLYELNKIRNIPNLNIPALVNWSTFFLILPVLIIVGCMMYVGIVCSPSTVFLWGDYEEYYNRLISTRKTLLNVIFLTIIFGVTTNVFVNILWVYIK